MKALLIILALSQAAHAGWFCTEESSQVKSDEVDACGTAYNATESDARAIALESAIVEFNMICSHSESCKNRKYEMIPARTECAPFKNGYRCYRMVRFPLHPKE
jgi:hypothetical protein